MMTKDMIVDRYSYRVIWSPEDKENVGLCAEFQSLSWLAPSQVGALKGIRKVVLDVLQDMRKAGERVNGDTTPRPLIDTPFRQRLARVACGPYGGDAAATHAQADAGADSWASWLFASKTLWPQTLRAGARGIVRPA